MMNPKLLRLASLAAGAAAQCNEDDHHPANGGFFLTGASGLSNLTNLDSAHGEKLPDNTWAPGRYYPYGEKVVCDPDQGFCSPGCDVEPGCEQYYSTHTCSVLHFCPPDGVTATEAVHELPDFTAAEKCDFSAAVKLGEMNGAGSNDQGCFEYVFEEDHELREYFFASQEGCADGQRLAVKVSDFSMTADQCVKIGLNTPRIRNCDCRLEKKPSTLGEPCRTAFSDSCQESLIATDDCCTAGNCLSVYEDYGHPQGKAAEDQRVAECDDDVPGLCYNEDGAGTDTNRQGSTNCCTMTCSKCGIQRSYSATWKPCEALNGTDSTAKCGFLSRYDPAPFQCDFTQCEEGDHWHTDGAAFQKAFGTSASVGGTSETGAFDTDTSETDTSGGSSVSRMTGVFAFVHLSFCALF